MYKNKEYYEKVYLDFEDNCIREAKRMLIEEDGNLSYTGELATEIFEETANAEQVIGFYVYNHKDCALNQWLENTDGIEFTEQDTEIDRELKRLYL